MIKIESLESARKVQATEFCTKIPEDNLQFGDKFRILGRNCYRISESKFKGLSVFLLNRRVNTPPVLIIFSVFHFQNPIVLQTDQRQQTLIITAELVKSPSFKHLIRPVYIWGLFKASGVRPLLKS